MKNNIKILKVGLVALLLGSSTVLFGQSITTKTPLTIGPGTSQTDPGRVERITPVLKDGTIDYETANSVLFFNPNNPGSGLTLVASTKEDHATRTGGNALDFTSYKWFYMGQDLTSTTPFAYGTTIPAGGLVQVSNKLPITGLSEGYHVFKVQGYILPAGADETAICEPDKEETFVVYVLPRLNVALSRTGGATTPLQYCETDAGTQTNVDIQADVDYLNYTGSPADVVGFELKYTWYSVKADASGLFPTIDDTKANLTGAVERSTATEVSTSASFKPTIAEIGKYKYFVEVEYTIKKRDYDGAESANARKRTYALYRSWFGGDGTQANATAVMVTPAPGKPHITIEAVND